MYDYTAANQDELSFSKGQLINILDKTNPDWWKGEVNGVTGLLPTNYVKMTTDSDPSQQCEFLSRPSFDPAETVARDGDETRPRPRWPTDAVIGRLLCDVVALAPCR